jgi:hypothetical protein
MQEAWIGRSEGAEVRFKLEDPKLGDLLIFTTRPDTLFGCTYMVLAPEHPLVPALTTPAQRDAVEAYRKKAAAKSDVERMSEAAKDKSGVFTGSHAINPGQRREGARLDRRLRAHGLRHRRHHGRAGAGRARLGIRQTLRPAHHPHRVSESPDGFTGTPTPATVPPSTAPTAISLDGLHVPEAKAKITAGSEAQQARQAHASTTSSATGSSPASATGASRSRSSGSALPITSTPPRSARTCRRNR